MRRHLLPSVVILAGSVLGLGGSAPAEELALQQGVNGYSGCEDTTLSIISPTRNYGASTYIRTWRGYNWCHSNTSTGGSLVWGANNAPLIGPPWRESWRYNTATVYQVADDLRAHWPLAFSGWRLDYITIHKKAIVEGGDET